MCQIARRTRWLLLAVVTVTWLAGCQPFDLRGNGYDEATQELTKNLRPEADEARLSGIDARARDIERNLGVR